MDAPRTQQDDRCLANSFDVNVSIAADVSLEIAAFQKQPIALDGLDVKSTTDQLDGYACACQHPAKVTTYRTCSNDCHALCLHRTSPLNRRSLDTGAAPSRTCCEAILKPPTAKL